MEGQNFEQENNRTLIGNMMQVELAERHGESIEDFITKHAGDFREVVDKHPEFLDEFEEDKELALKHVEDIVYH